VSPGTPEVCRGGAEPSPSTPKACGRGTLLVLPAFTLITLLVAIAASAQSAEELLGAGKKAFADGFYPVAADTFQRILSAFPQSSSEAEAEYLLGVSRYYSSRWQDCVTALEGFPDRHPASPLAARVPYWVGASWLSLGSYEKALQYLSGLARAAGATAKDPYTNHAALLCGVALEGLGRDAEAGAWYRKVTAAGDASLVPEAVFRLAGTEYRSGHYSAARDLYSRMLFDYSQTSYVRDSLFFLAECELALDNPNSAEKRLTTLMSLYKDSPYREAALYRLADIAYRRHDAPLAVRRLDELAGLFPQGEYEGSAERMRGDVFFDQKDYERAAFAYERSIADLKEGSERQAAWYSLGLAELMLDRKTKAAEALSKAAGQAGDLGEKAMYQRALLLVGLSRNDDAIQALDDMLGAYPESARSEEALKLLGSLLDSRLDFQKSLPLWDSLVKRYPRSASLAEYVYHRGTARMNLGDLAALDDFQQIVREFPASEFRNESEYSIGYIYSRRGEYARAISYFKGVSLRAAGAEVGERSSLATGVCLFNMGSFDEAITSLEYLRARAPAAETQAVVALYEGRALYRLQRLAEAAEHLSTASQLLDALGQPSIHAGQAADATYWLGWSLFRIGKLAEARDAFLSLSRKYPSDPRSLESIYRAGVCETLRGDDAAAVKLFSAAAGATETTAGAAGGPSEDQWREQALYEKGWALSRLGSAQDSLEAFHELAARFPNGRLAPEAFFKAATNAFDNGSYAEARSGFQALIRDFPGSALVKEALYWKAECARQSGDAREALEELWTCVISDPGQSVLSAALKGFDEALESLANISLARDFAQKAKDEKGLDVVVVASLELDYARMLLAQDASETLAVLDDVRHRSPPEPLAGEASLLTGQALAALSQWQRVIDILAPLSDSRADEVGARATGERARALEESGNLTDAMTQYLRIAYLFSAYADLGAEGMYNAARLALRMGDRENAARIQEGLRTRFPGSPWISRLQDLKGPRDANEPRPPSVSP